jgi:hypothetical protein
MTTAKRLLILILTGLLVTACTGTKTSESWKSQSYEGKIKKVYIIGIAKSEPNRMLFEDTFESRLKSAGVGAIASYKDLLPTNQEVERQDIIKRMRNNNCDSILLTRLVGQKKKSSISSGQSSYTYTPGPYGGYGPSVQRLPSDTPAGQRGTWYKYYNTGRMNYVAPTSLDNVILTVESVLYDLNTEEMIWSAQLETHLEGNIETMMRLFVEEVAKDLKDKGLI